MRTFSPICKESSAPLCFTGEPFLAICILKERSLLKANNPAVHRLFALKMNILSPLHRRCGEFLQYRTQHVLSFICLSFPESSPCFLPSLFGENVKDYFLSSGEIPRDSAETAFLRQFFTRSHAEKGPIPIQDQADSDFHFGNRLSDSNFLAKDSIEARGLIIFSAT